MSARQTEQTHPDERSSAMGEIAEPDENMRARVPAAPGEERPYAPPEALQMILHPGDQDCKNRLVVGEHTPKRIRVLVGEHRIHLVCHGMVLHRPVLEIGGCYAVVAHMLEKNSAVDIRGFEFEVVLLIEIVAVAAAGEKEAENARQKMMSYFFDLIYQISSMRY